MDERSLRMVFAGGGTAGHVNPIVSIIEEITRCCRLEALYFVNPGKIEERIIPARFPWIHTAPLRVKGLYRPLVSVRNLRVFFSTVPAVIEAMQKIRSFQPDCVFCTGGYITGPVAVAAWLLKVPVYLHEQNSIIGVANRFALRFAKRIFLSFPESLRTVPKRYREKALVTGNPVRRPRLVGEDLKRFAEKLGIGEEKPKILVMGGSKGSDFLNHLVEEVHDRIQAQLIVLTGSGRWTEKLGRHPNVIAFDYLEEVPDLMRIVDAAVTRGGATTIWELYVSGVPAVVIPWEGAAEGHQLQNAEFLQKMGNACVLREKEASADRVALELVKLLESGRKPALSSGEIVEKILSGIPEVQSKCCTT
ncbi:MAG: hypothetical protein DRP27_06920 [Thermotogae bacterium]|nr:MAG: hypothetical protein DRP27_06920 [Thermotogota bacterium]